MSIPPPLRVLICDDELVARKRMARLLTELGDVEIAAACSSGEEVLRAIENDDIDLMLLDVNMPGLTGIEAAMKMPEDRPYLIFATAHPEHAIDAFELGAVDYLLKPIELDRLKKAVDRARKKLDAPRVSTASLDRLAIPTHDGAVLLASSEITHAVFDGQLVTVHASGQKVLCGFSLQELEAKLPASNFERVHRRAIVNLAHIARLESTASGGYVARMTSGERVDVSRQSARRLRRRLGLT